MKGKCRHFSSALCVCGVEGGGGVMAALSNFHFILFKFKGKAEDCQYESESSVNVLFYFTYVEATMQ